MSVASILAFVLAGVAAKNRRADRQDDNRQELIALRVDNADLRRRVEELEGDVARANVQARRDQELIDIWRARALANIPQEAWRGASLPAGPDFRPPAGFGAPVPHLALQQSAAAMQQMQQTQYAQQANQLANQGLAQCNAQQAMNAQNYGLANVGLLGAQSLIDAELWCNCVPSRSQVWATSDPE